MEAERFEAGGHQVLLEYPEDVQAFASRASPIFPIAIGKAARGTATKECWFHLNSIASFGEALERCNIKANPLRRC